MTETNDKKRVLVNICPELYEIFEQIRSNIQNYSWSTDIRVSNYDISKVLAKKIQKQINILK